MKRRHPLINMLVPPLPFNPTGYYDKVISNEPVQFFPMSEEYFGFAVPDLSGNEFDGLQSNVTWANIPGPGRSFGVAPYLDGTAQIDCLHTAGLSAAVGTEFTACIWVFASDNPINAQIMTMDRSVGDAGNDVKTIGLLNGVGPSVDQYQFDLATPDTGSYTDVIDVIGDWQFLALTVSNLGAQLVSFGARGTRIGTHNRTPYASSDIQTLLLGVGFAGWLSAWQLYAGVLTDERIADLALEI